MLDMKISLYLLKGFQEGNSIVYFTVTSVEPLKPYPLNMLMSHHM